MKNYLKLLPLWSIVLILLTGCPKPKKEDPQPTDPCTSNPTACGCPQAPASCNDNGQTITGKVYVSPSGNDANDGSEAKPFKTIQKAADVADPKGLEIILRAGTHESKEIKFRTSNLNIHSYAGEWAVIKAVMNIEDVTNCIWFREPGTENITLENLEIVGGYYYGIKFESDWDDDRTVPYDKKKGISNVKIINCKIHDTGRDCIKIAPGCKDIQVLNCEIYRSGVGPANVTAQNAEGIDNVNADRMIVRNCYFHDIATNGLYAKGGAKDCVFEQNLLMNMGEGGLVAGYLDTDNEWFNITSNPTYLESINIIIRNNIVINTKREGIGLYAASGAQVYNNTLVNVANDEGSSGLIISRGEIYGTPTGDKFPNCRNLKISNNILVQSTTAKGQMARLRGIPEGTNDLSNNYYFKPSGVPNFRIDIADGDYKEFMGFDNWKTQSKFDATSSYADPKLDNKYHLSSGSPCIGAGKILAGVVDKDYDGGIRSGKWDLGADQFNAGTALAVPPPTNIIGTGLK